MDILFNNNIVDKKNPTIIILEKPTDIFNSAKFSESYKGLSKELKQYTKIIEKINKSKITNLNLVYNNEIRDLIIFKIESYKEYDAQLDGSLLYNLLIKNQISETSMIVSRGVLNKKFSYVSNFLTGLSIKSYSFDKYFTQEKNKNKKIKINVLRDKKFNKKFFYDLNLVQSINEAKNLIAEPANILYPETYAKRCLKLKKFGVKVKILNKNQLEKIGMRSILGVAQGSAKSPKVVIFEWKLKKNSQPTILIGKGVTFDTGGISIKPSRGMQEMIMDMGGSAIVVGSIMNAALNKINKPLVGIIGLVENMPDANAQRPGDIIKTYSGKTVEIHNTDAEGRLVLCDLISYVQKIYKPNSIIDFATLTGAIQAALGTHMAGLFSNNDILSKKLIECGKEVGEKLWRMPLGDEYDKDIDGYMADISNIGKTPYGGASTAAQFLHRFVENNIPWAHLDIAGVTWLNKDKGVNSKGPSGFAIKLISKFLKNK